MATNEDVEKHPGLRRLGANARIALGLMYESSRRDTIAITGLTVFQAAVPTLILLAGRSLINNVADRAGTSGADVLVFSVILLGAAWALMATLSDALDNIQVFAASRLKSWVLLRGQQRLLEKNATYASLDLHENPDRLNEQGLAQTGVGGVISLTWSLFQVATALLALLPLAILLATIGWWIPLVMLLAMGPNIYLTMSLPRREWTLREELAGETRKRDLLLNVILQSSHAKDIRLLGLSPTLVDAWRTTSEPQITRLLALRTRLFRETFLWSTLLGLLVLVPVLWTFHRVATGAATVGDFAIVLSSLAAVRTNLWSLFGAMGSVTDDLIGIEKYRSFMDAEPPVRDDVGHLTPPPPLSQGLAMEQVTFAYPGSEHAVLTEFSLALRVGESVALVGANGAGKTTISRLLTRLFDPASGQVRWDDKDTRSISPSALRERFAVIPQDFAQFPVTLRENVAFGRISNPPSDEEIADALRRVGLGELLEGEHPLDVPLTKELEGGRQLSGGQWQRVAIARAMIRSDQADVVIMDEPTAALDPQAEVDIVRRMLEMTAGKTALIISHRLGICTLVDRVVVLADGQIVEEGSHRELLARNGAYAEMFRSQAEWYR